MSDKIPCAIVARATPRVEWSLVAFTERLSVALRSAAMTEAQERDVFQHRRFEAKALRRVDFEAGRLRARIRG